ncbi:MAG: acylphosphatase [Ruminococcus sp.]|nr:acylphosphatase [Ruminococcus sp.]MBQ8966345.1 acylphosphatase [Ruminococcus sp.]
MERIRRHIIFHGMVQGVGFRYTAYYAARSCGVAGWVRNLPDDTVEAEVEGTEAAIDMMIQDLRRGRFIQIDYMDVKEIPLKGGSDFRIR